MSFLDYCKAALITPEAHLAASQDPRDLVPQPENDMVVPGISKIHGTGVFPMTTILPGCRVGLLLDHHLHRTAVIGRYINHSDRPNVSLRIHHGYGVELYAAVILTLFDEITMDYNDTILLRKIAQEMGL